MSLSRLIGQLAKRRLRNAPPLEETLDEAASQYLGKEAKLQTAADAIMVQDLKQLADEDREGVRHYKQKKGLLPPSKAKSGGKAVGDMIVCDDYITGNGAVGTLVAIVAIVALALAGFAVWRTTRPTPSPEQTINAIEDTDTQYELGGDFYPAPTNER